MKVLKKILIFIGTLILTMSIIALTMTNLLTSTVLNKDYALAKLDETDYYNQIFNYVENNFEKYMYQSGFDEEVLKNLITVDQIKDDTNKILSNIYDNAQETVSTDTIRNNLSKNINQFLDENNLTANTEDIDSFIDTICKEYATSISHYKYEENIYNGYDKIIKLIDKLKIISIICIVVSMIILLVTNLKNIAKFISYLGISSFASGLFMIFEKIYINSKIDVKNILILNDAISLTLRNIATEILKEINKNGIKFALIGFLMIIVFSILANLKNYKQEQN